MSLFIDIQAMQINERPIEIMTSSPAVAKKIKIKDLPKIKLGVYSMIALNNLVVYAVYFLQEHGVTATVEEIVSICFRLFPQSFALKNYPRWPDSALVVRRLNDGREKGNLKGNSMDGFSLKYRGKQLAKRVAKVLGLIQTVHTKIKKKAAIAKKKIALVQPIKVKARGTKIISQKKKNKQAQAAVLGGGLRVNPAPRTAQGAVVTKETKIVSQKKKIIAPVVKQSSKPSPQAITVKQESLPLIKVEEKRRKKAMKLPAPAPVKKAPIRKKQQKQSARKSTQPSQLTMALPIQQERKIKNIALVIPSHVSKEEKVKAGKFVHLMEKSDAYIHYKKNGRNSKIGEFDFRSLLLCTMESSRETLVKNLKLFKGYAGIHNRHDLIAFLMFCEDKFSYLLKPQNKPERKAKK